jgi:GTP-binding protein LepA
MDIGKIRNFVIIAHIDHGKSTLADRMIEETGTIDKRKMKAQVLDRMELERERGITIKMQPVRMAFPYGGEDYTLNLIDTPGHIDFSYEVSRALKAVEGGILLVDSTQGIQAQTLTTLAMAKELNLVIIPVLSKVDSPLARVEKIKEELYELLDCRPEEILEVSGKTGQGVKELMGDIVKKIPSPKSTSGNDFRALIFDFKYSTHKGVIIYLRVFDGYVKKRTPLTFRASGQNFKAIEVGEFRPEETKTESLGPGEIGYIVTGIKKPGIAYVGDTIALQKSSLESLPGYEKPNPVVWASVYPRSQDDFNLLRQSLDELRLSDSSISYEEESSSNLGRGFRCGFLGMLHLEVVIERLKREFSLDIIVTMPTVSYDVTTKDGKTKTIYSPTLFPEYSEIERIDEPWMEIKVIVPKDFLGPISKLLYDYEAEIGNTEVFKDGRNAISAKIPLRELMRNFFDELKSRSSGFASLSYEPIEKRPADVVKIDVLVADEVISAFSRIVSRRRIEEESKSLVKKLHGILPRQLFVTKIQAKALGRIVSSKTLSALRKDVTGHLYGGDITRKMKLLEKQKKGKKKMKASGRVNIPQEVFLKMVKSD